MNKPRLLDLFCSAGGTSVGYAQAGFEVVGVDIEPMPRYPFTFIQADALEYLAAADLGEFDVIHASPPCQSYSSTRFLPWANQDPAPKLILPVRECLEASGLPWVIENVPGADMPDALELCGSMFGLPIRRHRWFSCSHFLFAPGACQHVRSFYSAVGGKILGHGDYASDVMYKCSNGQMQRRKGNHRKAVGCRSMGIDWMTIGELCQAIPPAYTHYIGTQLLRMLGLEERAS